MTDAFDPFGAADDDDDGGGGGNGGYDDAGPSSAAVPAAAVTPQSRAPVPPPPPSSSASASASASAAPASATSDSASAFASASASASAPSSAPASASATSASAAPPAEPPPPPPFFAAPAVVQAAAAASSSSVPFGDSSISSSVDPFDASFDSSFGRFPPPHNPPPPPTAEPPPSRSPHRPPPPPQPAPPAPPSRPSAAGARLPGGKGAGGGGGGVIRPAASGPDGDGDGGGGSRRGGGGGDATTVSISLREEMSCVYGGTSGASRCSVEGVVSVRPTPNLVDSTFYLTMRDPADHIERLSFDATFVDETDPTPSRREEDGNRVFGVTVPEYEEDEEEEEMRMIKYSCADTLRPVPVLVQTKVRIAGRYCRVGVKIRSNPSNRRPLSDVAVLLPVPPEIDGESLKMSRRGGVWDAAKRIVVWDVPELGIGETLEVQSQFEFTRRREEEGGGGEGGNGEGGGGSGSEGVGRGKEGEATGTGTQQQQAQARVPPRFPVLVRCDARDDRLSGVDVHVGDREGGEGFGPRLALERSFRILYRKL